MKNVTRHITLSTFFWKNWPITLKLVLMMTLMSSLSIGAITGLHIYRERQVFRSELQQQATLLLDTLEVFLADSLYLYDADELADLMEALGRDREILVFGRVYDEKGRIAADAYDEALTYSLEIDSAGEALVNSDTTLFEWKAKRFIAGRPIIVGTQRLGAVSIGFSTAALQRKIETTRTEGLNIAVVAMIVGLLLSIFVSRSITGPLLDLVGVTKRIAEGDLTYPIIMDRGDEFAVLGRAMERMRKDLYRFYQDLERTVAERTQALQMSEKRFRLVIGSIRAHIYMVEFTADKHRINRYLSPYINVLTGYPVEDFMAENDFWETLIYPEDRPVVTAHLDKFFGKHDSEVEYRLVRADGQVIWVRDSGRVEKYPVRHTVTVYGVITDITQRKHAEKEQQQLQEQLKQAQQLEAVGKLAGGMAHEFNNLLAIIQGSLELTLDGFVEKKGAGIHHLEEALRTCQRGQRLISEILIFSRSSKQELQVLSPIAALQNALKLIQATLPDTIELRVHHEADCPPILANSLQIEQIVLNLCHNAMHAIGANPGVIEIALEEGRCPYDLITKEHQGNIWVKLSVRDTGTGILSDVQQRMFEPFFTTKKVGKGTGLGLSVVHGIVRQCGGHIAVNSGPSKGTMFEIFFPVAQPSAQTSGTSEVLPQPQHLKSANQSKIANLLFVTDNPQAIRLQVLGLKKLGYHVKVLRSPEKALKHVHDNLERVDAVFTDQALSGITGTAFGQKILQIRPDIPLILCSASDDVVAADTVTQSGNWKFLHKPLTIRQLTQILREVLAFSRSQERR